MNTKNSTIELILGGISLIFILISLWGDRHHAGFILLGLSLLITIAGIGTSFSKKERERVIQRTQADLPEKADVIGSPEAMEKMRRRGHIMFIVGIVLFLIWTHFYGFTSLSTYSWGEASPVNSSQSVAVKHTKVTLQEIKETGRYVSGVPATENDIKNNKAVFYIGGKVTPINIELPQYAWHTDAETKVKTLWIVIQAEENSGIRAYGAINPETSESMAGLESEFELIGMNAPAN